MTVVINTLKKNGIVISESDIPDKDIVRNDQHVVILRGGTEELVQRALQTEEDRSSGGCDIQMLHKIARLNQFIDVNHGLNSSTNVKGMARRGEA